MEFPESSTQKELSLTWLRIAEISDKDFGFTDLEKKTDKIRFSVRVLLYNDNGEIYQGILKEKNLQRQKSLSGSFPFTLQHIYILPHYHQNSTSTLSKFFRNTLFY